MAKKTTKRAAAQPAAPAAVAGVSHPKAREIRAFDAGKNQRRLRAIPTNDVEINQILRQYGAQAIARSRYLTTNNPYAAAAKREYVAALVGSGIKPSSLHETEATRDAIHELWLDWTDEADADGRTDFYGQQTIVAGEAFEAGECFVRLRPRRVSDGLSVPLQLQIMPSEMLDMNFNEVERAGVGRIECGIEFDAIGRRTHYHFWRQHPNSGSIAVARTGDLRTRVPASEVLHIFRPMRAGQLRGVPHTISAIVRAAVLDAYDDAELERKRIAALFGAFVTTPTPEEGMGPLGDENTDIADAPSFALEPGATVHLMPGEDIKFGTPADSGPNFEGFQYRALLAMSAGFNVPYANMTGDLRQTSFGSLRAGLQAFKRAVSMDQLHMLIPQMCRPIWLRWLNDAVLFTEGELPIQRGELLTPKTRRAVFRVKWMTPKWDWIDPLSDIQAEIAAVNAGFKSRDDVIEEMGEEPAQVDARIAASRDRAEALDLEFPLDKPPPPAPAPLGASPGIDDPDEDRMVNEGGPPPREKEAAK